MIVILDKAETPPMALHASMEEDDTSVAAGFVAGFVAGSVAGSVASSVASSVVSSMAIETRHLQRREKRGGENLREGERRERKGKGGVMGVRKPQRVSKLSAKVRENLVDKVVMKLSIWCNGS